MLEEKEDKLLENVEEENNSETTVTKESTEKTTEIEAANNTNEAQDTTETLAEAETDTTAETIVAEPTETEDASSDTSETPKNSVETEATETTIEENSSSETKDATEKEEAVLEEIDETNAEDAEDKDNNTRHEIPVLDYHEMSMENLVGELQRLVKNEKVQAIKKHIDGIKTEFDLKFHDFIDHKKEEFIAGGGNEIDFRYNSVTKRQFSEVYTEYREKRNQYYKKLEHSLKDNLTKRLDIINELKGLVNVEEDINTTYKNFKDIQDKWRGAGPIPRANYNDVWRTYHHHIEIFYDFLHLNRELRDLDFKHNLEEKLKIVERAETLGSEENLSKAFQELQTLHKIWKEDIGPVGKAHREEIWERFSNATKVLHQRRQEYYKEQDVVYEQNLEEKNEIISKITVIGSTVSNNHKALQQQIKELEQLREAFFKAGKVPQKVNEKTWAAFKEAVRGFNRNKNAYYKNLKKEQQDNLDKKRALLNLAISLKDSEEWQTTTSEMKRIQSDWKKIGHVPRKYSDKIWNEFKNTCNHYFDRLHTSKNKSSEEELANYKKKNTCLEKLKEFQLSEDKDKDISSIKEFISEWKSYGRVPYNKKNINDKFNRILDAIFKKLAISTQEAELLKYGDKLKELVQKDNERAIYNERVFIRRKIDESKNEVRQLENNLQFFSNASEDNPLVKDVIKNINNHKKSLETWQAKLKRINILENELNKKAEEELEKETSEEEE